MKQTVGQTDGRTTDIGPIVKCGSTVNHPYTQCVP